MSHDTFHVVRHKSAGNFPSQGLAGVRETLHPQRFQPHGDGGTAPLAKEQPHWPGGKHGLGLPVPGSKACGLNQRLGGPQGTGLWVKPETLALACGLNRRLGGPQGTGLWVKPEVPKALAFCGLEGSLPSHTWSLEHTRPMRDRWAVSVTWPLL